MDAINLQARLDAAVHIAVFGVEQTGIATKRSLMQPFENYSDNDVKKVAVHVLNAYLLAGLSALPPERIEQIRQDQAEYLEFVTGDE